MYTSLFKKKQTNLGLESKDKKRADGQTDGREGGRRQQTGWDSVHNTQTSTLTCGDPVTELVAPRQSADTKDLTAALTEQVH